MFEVHYILKILSLRQNRTTASKILKYKIYKYTWIIIKA